MKLKTTEAVELYEVMKQLHLQNLSTEEAVTIVTATASLRKVAEYYKQDKETAIEQCKPEGYDHMFEKVIQHNQAIAKGEQEGRLADAEIAQFDLVNRRYNNLVSKALAQLGSVVVDIPDYSASLQSLLDGNKHLTAGQLAIIGSYIEL